MSYPPRDSHGRFAPIRATQQDVLIDAGNENDRSVDMDLTGIVGEPRRTSYAESIPGRGSFSPALGPYNNLPPPLSPSPAFRGSSPYQPQPQRYATPQTQRYPSYTPQPQFYAPPPPPPADPIQAQMLQLMTMMANQNQMILDMQMGREPSRGPTNRGGTVDSQGLGSKEPKASDPDTFNGKQANKLCQFVTQCYLVFRLNPSRFPTEEVKVGYMASFLRDAAADAIRPLLLGGYALETSSVEAFVRYLEDNFGDPDEKGTARRKLKALKQTGNASEYFSKFRELMATVGWTDPYAIVDKAIDGLSSEMKDEIARSGLEFHNLSELTRFIVPLDNRMRRRDQEKKEEEKKSGKTGGEPAKSNNPSASSSSTIPKPSYPPRTNNTGTATPSPPNLNPTPQPSTSSFVPRVVTEEEKARRRREGLCSYCGGSDHLVGVCPKNKNPRPPLNPAPKA
jgi:hypothetical protein